VAGIESPPNADVKSPNGLVSAGFVTGGDVGACAGAVGGADIVREDKSLKALAVLGFGEVSAGVETTGVAAGAGFGA
jgi:hypothetical protein